jgi:hypothetical protein
MHEKVMEQVRTDVRTNGGRIEMIAKELSIPIAGIFETLALPRRDRLLVLAAIAAVEVGSDADMQADDFYLIAAIGMFRDLMSAVKHDKIDV